MVNKTMFFCILHLNLNGKGDITFDPLSFSRSIDNLDWKNGERSKSGSNFDCQKNMFLPFSGWIANGFSVQIIYIWRKNQKISLSRKWSRAYKDFPLLQASGGFLENPWVSWCLSPQLFLLLAIPSTSDNHRMAYQTNISQHFPPAFPQHFPLTFPNLWPVGTPRLPDQSIPLPE